MLVYVVLYVYTELTKLYFYQLIMPPLPLLKKGGILFCTCLSVGQSVDQAMFARSFDPFA